MMITEQELRQLVGLALKWLKALLESDEPLDSQELKRIVSTMKELRELCPPQKPEEEQSGGIRVVLEGELDGFSG